MISKFLFVRLSIIKPYAKGINSAILADFATKVQKNLHICNKFCTFVADLWKKSNISDNYLTVLRVLTTA